MFISSIKKLLLSNFRSIYVILLQKFLNVFIHTLVYKDIGLIIYIKTHKILSISYIKNYFGLI